MADTGATQANERLRAALRPFYSDVIQAGQVLAKHYTAVKTQADLVLAIQAAGHLLLAAEGLHDAAEALAKQGRQALAEVMLDVGCTHATDGELSLYLSRKRRILSVDDPSLLPPQFLVQPPLQPDRTAIKEAFARGEAVPGCSEIKPNEMQLNLKVEQRK
jgi:Siphovirus Gp157